MQEIITTASLLALISTITPGPLMALIIGETLKHGKVNGILIGMAPLITDLPIMLASVFILSKLQNLDLLLGLISLCGAGYLAYLAYGNITVKNIHLETTVGSKSLTKGIITNFLNPNPYIFYFSILAPIAIKGMKVNFLYGPLSVSIFLGVFVIGNTTVALSVHSIKGFLHSKTYLYVIRALGFILLFFSITFFREGLKFFQIVK